MPLRAARGAQWLPGHTLWETTHHRAATVLNDRVGALRPKAAAAGGVGELGGGVGGVICYSGEYGELLL